MAFRWPVLSKRLLQAGKQGTKGDRACRGGHAYGGRNGGVSLRDRGAGIHYRPSYLDVRRPRR
eukprot:917664-Amorphochlora_amoeboformis.AAC.2